jgi:hypothetical protein
MVKKIENIWLIKIDFVSKSNEDILYNELRTIYGIESESSFISEQVFSINQSTNKTIIFEDKEPKDFQYFSTFVIKESKFVYDVITIAILKDEDIELIEERKIDINEYQDRLYSISKRLPIYSFEESSLNSCINYIRFSETNSTYKDNKLDLELCRKFITENESFLNIFGLNSFKIISLTTGDDCKYFDYFVSYQETSIWGPLTVFDTKQINKMYLLGGSLHKFNISKIIDEFSTIRRMYRFYYWGTKRLMDIKAFDEISYNFLKSQIKSESYSNLLTYNNKLNNDAMNWLSSSQDIKDELSDLIRITPYISNNLGYVEGQVDYSIKLKIGLRVIGEPQSIFYFYIKELNYLLDRISSDIDRVDLKFEKVSNFFNNSISIHATKINTWHVRIMTLMTIIILLATLYSAFNSLTSVNTAVPKIPLDIIWLA